MTAICCSVAILLKLYNHVFYIGNYRCSHFGCNILKNNENRPIGCLIPTYLQLAAIKSIKIALKLRDQFALEEMDTSLTLLIILIQNIYTL